MAVYGYFGTCLDSDALSSLARTCSPSCSSCFSPSYSSCLEYAPLIDQYTIEPTSTLPVAAMGGGGGVLGGRDYGGLDMSYCGWVKNGDMTGARKLVQVWNGNCSGSTTNNDGCRVMSQSIDITGLKVVNTVFSSSSTGIPMPGLPLTTDISASHWFFFSVSNCYSSSSSVTQCYAKFTDTSVTCETAALTNPTFPFNKGSSTAGVYVGDSPWTSGSLVDVRFYTSKCLTPSDLTALLRSKQTACIDGCQTCSEPGVCTTCGQGYYIQAGNCVRCNACCSACSGPGSVGVCSECASGCVMEGTLTCIRKIVLSLLPLLRDLFRQPPLQLPDLPSRLLPPARQHPPLSPLLSLRLHREHQQV